MTDAPTGLRILVVEDEPLIALMLQDMLDLLGHEVVAQAKTMDEALQAAPTVACDAAILDVNLQGQPIYPVAELLKARTIPFLFATGLGTMSIDPRYAQVPLIEKPYRLEDIERQLHALVC